MNKKQQELLDKCVNKEWIQVFPLFDELYVIPTKRKHNSGYKIMIIIGYERKQDKYYLVDSGCDVLDFEDLFKHNTFKDLHIDIKDDGIIRYFSRKHKFKNIFNVSSCTFSLEDNNNE